jgi:hypothetical protein
MTGGFPCLAGLVPVLPRELLGYRLFLYLYQVSFMLA